jgi:hypothetical protein
MFLGNVILFQKTNKNVISNHLNLLIYYFSYISAWSLLFYRKFTLFKNILKDIESTNDSSVLSHKTTSCNSSINTIDEITKSFENAINVGEKYLSKLKIILA